MRTLRQLAMAFAVVFVAVLVDCGFLYYQAKTGKRLPFRMNLSPRIDGDIR